MGLRSWARGGCKGHPVGAELGRGLWQRHLHMGEAQVPGPAVTAVRSALLARLGGSSAAPQRCRRLGRPLLRPCRLHVDTLGPAGRGAPRTGSAETPGPILSLALLIPSVS
jgi:hypothetical protein